MKADEAVCPVCQYTPPDDGSDYLQAINEREDTIEIHRRDGGLTWAVHKCPARTLPTDDRGRYTRPQSTHHERLLADALGKVLAKIGVADGTMALTGPQLLLLAEDFLDAPPPDDVPTPLERIAVCLEEVTGPDGILTGLVEAIQGLEVPAGVDGDDVLSWERTLKTGLADIERAVRGKQ